MHIANRSQAQPGPSSSPLLRNLLLFGRVLRAVGVRTTSHQVRELALGLHFIDIGSRDDFRNAARCLLVSRHEDFDRFDRAFDAFWTAWPVLAPEDQPDGLIEDITRDQSGNEQQSSTAGSPGNDRATGLGKARAAAAAHTDDLSGVDGVLALYSPGEALRSRDFSRLSVDELADARRFLGSMQWSIARRRSLRLRAANRGKRLDVRRSVRQNLRYGGELLHLVRRRPKMKRRQLVLLCDISGSMDRYTRMLLHFLHSVESSLQRSEVFVFGTRLTRITRALRRRDPDAAIAAAAAEVQDWSGGTRIGEAIHTFNQRWARRVLGHGAIVIIISDGWDRGDPALLGVELARLQRSSYRLIWLNPLLGAANYEPLTQGIRAALPYVDDFLPVHNLASLEALATLLNRVQEERPERKQAAPRVTTTESDKA